MGRLCLWVHFHCFFCDSIHWIMHSWKDVYEINVLWVGCLHVSIQYLGFKTTFVEVLALIVYTESCQTNWVVVHFNQLPIMMLILSTTSFLTVDHYVKDLYEI
jgi:hypothetical protein